MNPGEIAFSRDSFLIKFKRKLLTQYYPVILNNGIEG